MPRYLKNVWAMMRQVADAGVFQTASAGVPVNGTSGTGAGVLGPGSTYINTTNGVMYFNSGTTASPVWTALGSAVGNAGLGVTSFGKATYDFTVDAGAIGPITPSGSPTLPSGAIIIGGYVECLTLPTSSGLATIALGTSAGSSASSLLAATAIASFVAGTRIAIIPVFTAASSVKLTAAGALTLTIAAFALTAGKFSVHVIYTQGT